MRHMDIWGIAESFLEFFHVNPLHHYVGVFIDLVYRVSDVRLWKIAVVASVYVDHPLHRGLRLVVHPPVGGVDGDRLGLHLHPVRGSRSVAAARLVSTSDSL